MIEDTGIFGYSRAGSINGIEYPYVINVKTDFVENDGKLNFMGEEIDRMLIYPSQIKQEIVETESFVIIPNGAELIRRPKNLVSIIMNVHEKYGFSKLIYLSGLPDPYSIPALVYLGVSFFDDAYFRIEGINGLQFTQYGIRRTNEDQTENNMNFVRSMLNVIKDSIMNGTLRDIVEKNLVSSKAAEMIRIADYSYYEEYEKIFPSRTPYIKANTIEDLYRPDIVRYREYVANLYEKPDLDVAVILPCSAKKPYSKSKSHQKVINSLSDLRKYIHEIIVTSPLGVVPRDLEETYPAMFYDIPVIGLWYEDEKVMMKRMLRSYMSRNKYRKVIAFVPDDLEFITDSIPYDTEFIEFKSSNLSKLRQTVEKEKFASKSIDQKKAKYESVLKYQFGSWILPLINGYSLRRNYNQDMIVKDGKILFVYNERLGKFTINKASAEMFVKNGRFLVEIDDFKPTSNVYAMGVRDATDDIRQEDEVVLVHSGEIRGVGIAKMNARAMMELKKGIAVKVR
ncbi:DUF5591 domain-containing protein [Thermoplasma volcanium]|nr:DUF5591 domain-containing protein [Thermoplasma volcanium]